MTGATAAALTVYDMCKSVSKEGLLIKNVELLSTDDDGVNVDVKKPQTVPETVKETQTSQKKEPERPSRTTTTENKITNSSKSAPEDSMKTRTQEATQTKPQKKTSEVRDKLGELIEQIQKEEAAARRGSK